MNHYPIDDSELLCAATGCDNPYPCAQHQAFEAAACAPPFLVCNYGSSDAPRAGCTSAERCTAAGKCLAPLPALPPPPPAEDDDQTRQDAPPAEVYQLNPQAAAGVPEAIEDAPTMRLPGRARRNPLINGLDFDDPRRPQITAQRRIKVPEMRLNNPADLDQLIRELQALRPHMEQDYRPVQSPETLSCCLRTTTPGPSHDFAGTPRSYPLATIGAYEVTR